MKFLTAVHTDVGIRKKTNQDSLLVMQANAEGIPILFAIVCDGMGGLAKGEVASAALVKAYHNWFKNGFPKLLCNFHIESLKSFETELYQSISTVMYEMNTKILNYGNSCNVRLGTTIALLLIIGKKYYILNIGDSRIYRFSDAVYQLTKDQTYVQREVDCGRMTLEEAEHSKNSNVLLQCIGASRNVEPDFYAGEVHSGEVYMLCSDGLRHLITPQEFYDNLKPSVVTEKKIMQERIEYLTETVKQRQERDNISVILVRTV